ncbi:MAG: sensor protein [Gemmatimonadetes bacterium]|nr:sensor protein [Gemmatimonadota bacterium]
MSDAGARVVELVSALADRERRAEAAQELAEDLGARRLVIFLRDAETGALLTAPGFPQTLPDGRAWREFLSTCVERGEHRELLRLRAADELGPAIGFAPGPDAVIVLLGATDSPAGISVVLTMLPLLTRAFEGERAADYAAMQVRSSRASATRASTLARTLDQARLQLEAALAQARDASRAKSDFLATMSHELRTPLNAIAGHVQLLEMGLHGAVTAEQRNALLRIKLSQRHLLGLINDVLNFSRIEAGHVEYQLASIPLADTFSAVTPMIESQFATRGVRFELRNDDTLPSVCADGEKLRQVLLNLLANAAKFTERGGLVWAGATLSADDPSQVQIIIVDTGRGIPPDKLDFIFEPFTQVNATHTRSEEGTGLGLAISRDLARGMGGDITVRSSLGHGSAFTVTLPAG